MAQIRLYEKEISKGQYHLFAENTAPVPYTIKLNLKLKNMISTCEPGQNFVIPPKTTDLQLTTLKAGKGKYAYHVQFESTKGINTGHHHDDHYIYSIPVSQPIKIIQGYGGKFSHVDKKALDFGIKQGSDVLAAREGIVLETKEDGRHNCLEMGCEKEGNYIKILHSDGSVASYYHLKHKGVLVDVGHIIEKGQLIGLTGNTGFSSEPHLHFEVYSIDNGKKKFHSCKFQISANKVIAGDDMKPKS
ncbi:MAG: M23 family metallopeptidase [Saprospiraceae bacterium]|nr:M23 family metallopeptidase [Saprospiraceae bacterium]MBP6398927.1 M23 family metallopeptidase [Saprospiraceae bacterium]